MAEIVEQALTLWGMKGADYRLIAARENQVYRIDYGTQVYALRLHREAYRSDAELQSELQWMAAVSTGGLSVPAPIVSVSGEVLQLVEGIQIDMLHWLCGATLSSVQKSLTQQQRDTLFHSLGGQMARLHQISDAWQVPSNFRRWAWDRNGLLGETPIWDRFWDNPTLTAEERALFKTVRCVADRDLAALETELDYGLIHADLVSENVMVDADKIQLIDFDDSGFGFRIFDLATALVKYLDEPYFDAIKTSLLSGYRSVRPLDTSALDLFMLLRAVTYVGWIIERLQEEQADVRNRRNILTAKKLAQAYLK